MQTHIGATKQPNPFNPGSPVDPNDFVGRIQYLNDFEQKLRQTSSGSLANIAVTGGYGIGKTSFLHKCNFIAEQMGALSVYFSLNEIASDLDRATLANVLIERIKIKVNEEVILKRLSTDILNLIKKIKVTSGSLSLGYKDVEESSPNLQSALAKIWGGIKSKKSSIVFLIDEAAMLERRRADLVLYLRAVLESLQLEHIPVMIVPAGRLTIYGPSGSGFSPLVRTFTPVLLENFKREESDMFITKRLKHASISISDDLLEKVYSKTEGHPFVLSAYMYEVYNKMAPGEKAVEQAHLSAVDLDFVYRVLAPFFARFYDQAGKGSRLILTKMAENNGEISLSELSSLLKKENNELSPNLAKLVQDGAIVRVERGKYKLFHHLLGDYIKNQNR